MKVLGVSGFPIENSNTDKIVKTILEASGLDTEFIKLTDFVFAPCRACLGCRNTNECEEVRDDGIRIKLPLHRQERKKWSGSIFDGFVKTRFFQICNSC